MKQVPDGFWKKRENRVKATNWMVEETGKKPTEITRNFYYRNKR